MADKPDLYEVLGVPRDAAPDALKAAYRAKAKQLHPDVAGNDPDATEKFRAMEEAYRVLSSSESRRIYDETGEYDAKLIATIEARAGQIITHFVVQFIDSGHDPDQDTFEDGLIASTQSQIEDYMAAIPMVEGRIRRAERFGKIAKRRDGARGGDVIQQAVAKKLRSEIDILEGLQINIKVAKRVLEIIADYEFERERQMFITTLQMFSNSTSGGFFHGR